PDLQAPGDVWDLTLAHVGGRVEAHVVSLAGLPGSPPMPGTEPLIPAVRDALARRLRAREMRKTVLVGHVFGASVAYSLALSDPDLVGGAVAFDPPRTVAC